MLRLNLICSTSHGLASMPEVQLRVAGKKKRKQKDGTPPTGGSGPVGPRFASRIEAMERFLHLPKLIIEDKIQLHGHHPVPKSSPWTSNYKDNALLGVVMETEAYQLWPVEGWFTGSEVLFYWMLRPSGWP
ncbi:hypothetical protein VTI74DRAFT_5138 [Chaetomium olivicolor]